MYNQIIIYKKPNGRLLYRALQYEEKKEIGESNSYGWIIVGKQKIKDGKCYPITEYNSLLQRKRKWGGLKTKIKTFFSYFNPAEVLKWAFIGYVMLKLCQ